jgi:hypothetical protein
MRGDSFRRKWPFYMDLYSMLGLTTQPVLTAQPGLITTESELNSKSGPATRLLANQCSEFTNAIL